MAKSQKNVEPRYTVEEFKQILGYIAGYFDKEASQYKKRRERLLCRGQ